MFGGTYNIENDQRITLLLKIEKNVELETFWKWTQIWMLISSNQT